MNRGILFMAGIALPAILNAQTRDWDPYGTADAAVNWPGVAAGGGRLFFALIVGVLLAMAFQWILTTLSAATGISALGKATRKLRRRSYYPEDRYRDRDREEGRWRPEPERTREYGEHRQDRRERDDHHEPEWEKPAQKIQAGAGLWVMVTASISAFFAAWLAAELIRFGGRAEAIIMGLAVWAGFMFTMMWVEATLLGTLLGSIMTAFKGGMKAAAVPLASAAGAVGHAASATAEEIAAKVREEYRAQGGGSGLKDKLKEYLGAMQSRSFDRSRIEHDVDDLFDDSEIREAARTAGSLEKRRFQEIVTSRGDLSAEEQKNIVEVLHHKWNRLASDSRGEGGWSAGTAYASSETRSRESAPQALAGETPVLAGETPVARAEQQSAKTFASNPYAGTSSAFAASSSAAGGTRATAPRGSEAPAFAARLQTFKDFLRGADKRDLNPVRIEQEVESLVIHPEEGFANMEKSVREVKRDEVSQALRQRRDITLEEADSIADLVDSARTRMLSRSEIREHRVQEITDKALSRVRDYVYSLKRPELDLEGFKGDFARMLEDPKGGFESLKAKASGIDRETLIQSFSAKSGISRQEAEKMADQAEQALRQAEENARRIEEETRRRVESAKRAAAENAESTRKLAASAAWWLFAVAVITAAAAALGGLTGAAT